MLIASWNVNSIITRLSQVTQWIDQNKPDIICLQETKVIDKDFPFKSFENMGYEVIRYGQKSYNGVAIISKFKPSDIKNGFNGELFKEEGLKEFEDQKRIVSAFINGLRIVNVYVPNGSSINSEKFEYKLKWLEKLALYFDEQEKRGEYTCLLGDFNIALSEKDIHNPKKYEGGIMASMLEREALNNVLKGRFIDSFRIFEKNSGHWSWWDYRNNAYELNKGWRIDHIYINNNLASKVKSCVIDKYQRENIQPSDHVPVMINLELDENSEVYENYEDDFLEI